MAETLIISFIAHDRPGIVEQLSEIVTSHGGNWLESRMANLADMFAGVARISIGEADADQVMRAFNSLQAEGFQLTVRPAGRPPSASGANMTFEVVGPDHPGIVHDLTRTIAGLGASVEEMETRIDGAPVGGGVLFYARTRVRLPDNLSEDDFRDALEQRADALIVDIVIDGDD